MNGAVELYQACAKHGVKPILGCEIYLVDDHAARGKGSPSPRTERNHLTLLAATPVGYRNLVKLSSAGFLDGLQRGKPSAELGRLASHADGGIGLTGRLRSRFYQRLLADALAGARAQAPALIDICEAGAVSIV